MTDKKTEAEEAAEAKAAAEAKHLADVQAFEAERVRLREAAQAEENARLEAEAKAKRVIAVLSADGVLIARVDNPTDEQWTKAKPECRFPNGFDNALHRYRLVEWRPDRFRFEAVVHEKDEGAENLEGSPKILAPLVRAVLGDASPADVSKLRAFLKSFDAQGN